MTEGQLRTAFAALWPAGGCDGNGSGALLVDASDAARGTALSTQGYSAGPVHRVLAAPPAALAPAALVDGASAEVATFSIWPPLAIQWRLWAEGEGSVGRRDEIVAATGARTALLARQGDRAAGTGLVALHGEVAVLSALEVMPICRRQGVGAALVRRAALWAGGQGARSITLAVAADAPAMLFERLGFSEAGRYAFWSPDRGAMGS